MLLVMERVLLHLGFSRARLIDIFEDFGGGVGQFIWTNANDISIFIMKSGQQELRPSRNDLKTPGKSCCSVKERPRIVAERMEPDVVDCQNDVINGDLVIVRPSQS